MYFNNLTGIITATFQVRSEYGELSGVYTIEINREPASTVNDLNGLKISNGSTVFLDENATILGSYDIRVNRDINSVVIKTTVPLLDRPVVMSPYQRQTDEGSNKVFTYVPTLNNLPNANPATIHQNYCSS